MNDRWQLVFDFIRAYTKKHGVGPSYAALASGLGMKSRANMHRIVKRLEGEGLIHTRPKKFYSIKVVDRSIDDVASL